ncbi:hypothetical protein AAKU67_004139 [Oxalobacteraceae bacterium GrIS 2.11]
MKKLFQTINESDRKSVVIHVRVTAKEAESITLSASARDLTLCEFIRRTSLGRKTDIRYESHIIRELREIAKIIKLLHDAVGKNEITYFESEWTPVIDEIISAMRRIEK